MSCSTNHLDQRRSNDLLIAKLCKDPRYIIHPCGKIETTVQRTGKVSAAGTFRLISLEYTTDGYVRIKYNYKMLTVHRIVYQKFIGDLNPYLQINHKDGNKKNNHFSNLELVTQSENINHLVGVLKRKPILGQCKINFEIAEKIRADRGAGSSHKDIAAKYGVSPTTVCEVVNYKTWKPGKVYHNV